MRKSFLHGQVCTAACIGDNMLLTATALGLGSVFLTGLREAVNQDVSLLKRLNMSSGFEVAVAVALGCKADETVSGRGSHEGRFEAGFL